MKKSGFKDVVSIVQDAEGMVTGRTRLQKIAYLLYITDLGADFEFSYKHYGPYSEQLSSAIAEAKIEGQISEEEKETAWGGTYSIFRIAQDASQNTSKNSTRKELIAAAKKANAIDLELAATAAFLSIEGEKDPWAETERRKPLKAESRLKEAKDLYKRLREITLSAKKSLPNISN